MQKTTGSRTRAMVAVAAAGVAALGVALAPTASADPVTRLPDADLVCGDTTLAPSQWVSLPPSGTLWITETSLAGHYVILEDAHYLVPGYLEEPPDSYTGLDLVDSRTYGLKTGRETPMTCDFVSRWGEQGDPDTFSVVGPVTIARVPGASG